MKPEDRALSPGQELHKYNIAQKEVFYSVYYTESIKLVCFYLASNAYKTPCIDYFETKKASG